MKKIRQLAMAILTVFVTALIMAPVTFAEETNKLTTQEAWNEIVSQLKDGVKVELEPGETKQIPVSLSDGETAYLEVGFLPLVQTFGMGTGHIDSTAPGGYTFYAGISGGAAGSYTHRVNVNVSSVSPVCKFSITSATIEGQTPSVGMTNGPSGITDIVNYEVGTCSYSRAYASFTTPIKPVPINIYDKVLMNSFTEKKIEVTIYYDFVPIS